MKEGFYLTEGQKAKVFEDVGKIVEYIHGLQPGIICDLVSSWGAEQYGLRVTRSTIVGESPLFKYIEVETPAGSSSSLVSIRDDLDFAISLVVNWQDVKIELNEALEDQRWAIDVIENFEV